MRLRGARARARGLAHRNSRELIARIRALERAKLSAFAFQVTGEPERQIRDFARLVMDRY